MKAVQIYGMRQGAYLGVLTLPNKKHVLVMRDNIDSLDRRFSFTWILNGVDNTTYSLYNPKTNTHLAYNNIDINYINGVECIQVLLENGEFPGTGNIILENINMNEDIKSIMFSCSKGDLPVFYEIDHSIENEHAFNCHVLYDEKYLDIKDLHERDDALVEKGFTTSFLLFDI